MRSERQFGKTLLAYSLTAVFLVACLILPEGILTAWGQEKQGTVLEADKEYYSRPMKAYMGELNEYRKLLMMQGVWKSEKTLAAEGILAYGELQGRDEKPLDILSEEEVDGLNQITQILVEAWSNSDMAAIKDDVAVTIYEFRDTVIGKYQFFVADLELIVEPLYEPETEMVIRVLADVETGEILALQVPPWIEKVAWQLEWEKGIFWESYFGELEDVQEADLTKELFQEPMGWERPEDFQVFHQLYRLKDGSFSSEKSYFVVQGDSEGMTFFSCLGPDQIAED